MGKYITSIVKYLTAVVVKLSTVVIVLSYLLTVLFGGFYFIYLFIVFLVGGWSYELAFLYLLGGICVLILIIPVFLKIWNVIEEKYYGINK
tara:strand:- start:6534 stop:6806 length:273 start_codon:yes stop_codon:yes gene_type:complete